MTGDTTELLNFIYDETIKLKANEVEQRAVIEKYIADLTNLSKLYNDQEKVHKAKENELKQRINELEEQNEQLSQINQNGLAELRNLEDKLNAQHGKEVDQLKEQIRQLEAEAEVQRKVRELLTTDNIRLRATS